MAKIAINFSRYLRHNGENGEKIDGENGINGKMAKNNGEKYSPLWQKWRENVRHFCHNGENGEIIDGKMAKINGENDEIFFAIFDISPWPKSRKKINGEWQ